VPLVWIVDPMDETVTVYRPNAEPVLFNRTQTLEGFAELPGFSCKVSKFFE
jgi:Uma2 family endonuclease